MTAEELQEAIREAIANHIPFQIDPLFGFGTIARIVDQVATELGYCRELPHCFRDRAHAFYLDPVKGLRWGYVQNDRKVGWYETRETTPLPERAVVIKDSAPVYGQPADLLDQTS